MPINIRECMRGNVFRLLHGEGFLSVFRKNVLLVLANKKPALSYDKKEFSQAGKLNRTQREKQQSQKDGMQPPKKQDMR